jgi:peptidoglycan/LPS O-acetylase OafA/YrhL
MPETDRVGSIAISATDRPHHAALDSLRGLAALSVVFFHLSWTGPLYELAYVRNSYLMVDVFFVLSGFVIFHAYQGRVTTLREARRFLWLRFWRVYPVHFLFLMVFVAIAAAKLLAQSRFGWVANHPALEQDALASHLRRSDHVAGRADFIGWMAAAAIILFAGFVALHHAVYMPLAVFPLAAWMIFLIALAPVSPVARLLELAPLGWLGRISYSVYMAQEAVIWLVKGVLRMLTHAPDIPIPGHQPILAVTPAVGITASIVTVLLVLGVAQLTYRFVEAPWRAWSRGGYHPLAFPVMAGLDPAIHVETLAPKFGLLRSWRDVDGQVKPGHDVTG